MYTLIIDDVKFNLWIPQDELREFHPLVEEHSKDIFGYDIVYFDINVKLKSIAGLTAKPDGFVIDLTKNKWYIIEVELSKHNPYDHIVNQLTRFINGIDNPKIKDSIVDALYNEINKNKMLRAQVEEKVEGDIHHWLSKLLSQTPKIVVIIEEKTEEVVEACKILMKSFETYIVELKTFVRENAENVHAHLFEPLTEAEPSKEEWDAFYDNKEKGFVCNLSKRHYDTIYDTIEIVEHLRDEHDIDPDDQRIDGWTDKDQSLWDRASEKKPSRRILSKKMNELLEQMESGEVKELLSECFKRLRLMNLEMKPLKHRWISVWHKGKRFMYIGARKKFFKLQIQKSDGTWLEDSDIRNKEDLENAFSNKVEPTLKSLKT